MFRTQASREVKWVEAQGLPAFPAPNADALSNARRTMDQLVAKQQYSKQVRCELVLPQLSAENLEFLEPRKSEKAGLDAGKPISNSFFQGLGVVGRVLDCFTADEFDQLLLDCNADEREVMIASLVLKLRSER